MADQIEDYKSDVDPELRVDLQWEDDLYFSAATPTGYDFDFDAANQMGCMPLEALVASLAGCMAIDVVAILRKMRCEPEACSMSVRAERSRTPPQRITEVHLDLTLSGDLPEDKVRRAVSLSEDRYCSVRHSLREDIEITTVLHIVPSG